MTKEAYWFKHDSNAKDDPKCIILIEELGLEGYGIFWVLVETLRAQPDFKAPLRILPAIARRHNTSTEKVKAVITRYELFVVEAEDFFYSPSLIDRMQPLIEKKKKLQLAGKKGAKARWGDKNGVANGDANGVANGNKSREEKKKLEKNTKGDFVSKLDEVKTHEQAFDLWAAYRKKKGKHTNLYEKEVMIKSEWKDLTPREVAKAIKYTVSNGWVTLQFPEQKEEEKQFDPDIARLRAG